MLTLQWWTLQLSVIPTLLFCTQVVKIPRTLQITVENEQGRRKGLFFEAVIRLVFSEGTWWTEWMQKSTFLFSKFSLTLVAFSHTDGSEDQRFGARERKNTRQVRRKNSPGLFRSENRRLRRPKRGRILGDPWTHKSFSSMDGGLPNASRKKYAARKVTLTCVETSCYNQSTVRKHYCLLKRDLHSIHRHIEEICQLSEQIMNFARRVNWLCSTCLPCTYIFRRLTLTSDEFRQLKALVVCEEEGKERGDEGERLMTPIAPAAATAVPAAREASDHRPFL